MFYLKGRSLGKHHSGQCVELATKTIKILKMNTIHIEIITMSDDNMWRANYLISWEKDDLVWKEWYYLNVLGPLLMILCISPLHIKDCRDTLLLDSWEVWEIDTSIVQTRLCIMDIV